MHKPIVSALIEVRPHARKQAAKRCKLTLPELIYQIQQGLELDGRAHYRPTGRNSGKSLARGEVEVWVPVGIHQGKEGTAVVIVSGKEPPRARVVTVRDSSAVAQGERRNESLSHRPFAGLRAAFTQKK